MRKRNYAYFPEKMIATQTVGPYEVKMRSLPHWENADGFPIYAIAVWKDWKKMGETNWTSWEAARREFDYAKAKAAIKLAEDVLFNQGDHQ